MRAVWPIAALSSALVLPLSCHLVGGLGDLEFTDTGPGGGTTISATTSSSGGSGGGGGAAGSGGGGAGGSGGAAFCMISIADNFDDQSIDSGLWNVTQAQSADVGENAAGRLFLAPWADTAPAWGEVLSVATYDLTECSVVVELPQVLANDADLMTMFTICAGTWENSAGFTVRNGMLASREMSGGSEIELAETTYVAGQHRWLRLRETAGTLYYETSSNAQTWTEQLQASAPSYVTNAYIRFAGGTWSSGSSSPGEAHYDNLNLLP